MVHSAKLYVFSVGIANVHSHHDDGNSFWFELISEIEFCNIMFEKVHRKLNKCI